MSTLYSEIDVEVVRVTLTHKVTGDLLTYDFSEDYWSPGSLYGTNISVYPLLAGPVQVKRGIDRFSGVKYSVSVQIYGDTYVSEYGKSFIDALEDYEVHNGDVTVYYYAKPIATITSHSDSVNIRQKLKVVGVGFDSGGNGSGIVTLQCADVWFKDKEISKRLDATTLTNLDSKYVGEYGAIVFGQSTTSTDGIPIDSPIFDSKLEGSPQRPTMKTFGGWTFPDHANSAFKRLLVKNQNKNQVASEWLEVRLPADPQTQIDGESLLASTTDASLTAYTRGIVYSPSTKAEIISMIRFYSATAGSPTSSTGTLQAQIFDAQYQPTSDTYSPVGSTLRTESKDPLATSVAAGTDDCDFMLDVPFTMAPGAKYFVIQEWSNTTDTTNYAFARYNSTVGQVHYARDNSQRDRGWAKQTDYRLAYELFIIGDGDDAWKDSTTSGADRYSYYHLEGASSFIDSGQTRKEINKGLEFKLCVSGLEDDGSGTYTGVASAVIERPMDIIKFALMNSDFGLGLSSAYVDVDKFDDAVTDMGAAYPGGLVMQIVIDSQTTVTDLIIEICRQARMIFYRTRVGKLAVKVPLYSTSLEALFSEAYHRGDFILESYGDNDYSTIVNDFRQSYKPDILNQSDDPALARRDPRVKLSNELILNETTSTADDDDRIAKCLASQNLYGKRQHTALLNYYDSATYAQHVQNYYCDRYSRLQKRARIRIPRKDYFDALDLFALVGAQHTAIPSAYGTALKLNAQHDGTMITTYDEGVPVLRWAGGSIWGEVLEIEESGHWMTLTIETVSPY